MKEDILITLREFLELLRQLKKDVVKNKGVNISAKSIREKASKIADIWVEELRSPLEHKFKLDGVLVDKTSQQIKRLHVLSRPNNKKKSYLNVLDVLIKNFENTFILPIQQTSYKTESEKLNLNQLIPGLSDSDESDYLSEAIACAEAGYKRAAVVLGWCAAINRLQNKILSIGFETFNKTSVQIKNQDSGKFKRWNKEFKITNLSELQKVFDTDLIVVLEGMQLIDGNQAERLETCFQYRCHGAHPGDASIEDPHLVAFFTDIFKIILTNENFVL